MVDGYDYGDHENRSHGGLAYADDAPGGWIHDDCARHGGVLDDCDYDV